jgi:cystathionine gamma-synthase
MNQKKKPGIASRAIHAGEPRERYADTLTTPIFQTSTFVFKDSKDIEEYTRGNKPRFEYGRYGNPTELIAGRRLADLEGAEESLIFSSGMMAIATTILSLVRTGDHIVITDDSYKKTLEFCNTYLQRFGVECTVVPFGDYDALDRAVRKNTKFIFSESPTNPYLNVFDLVRLKEIADRHGVMTLIDSTIATPINQRPLEFGIDLVTHSATKYLSGHNDILAGVVLGDKELITPIRNLHKSMGGLIDPHCCYLLLRGLKTFPMRVERMNATALKVASYLESHPAVERVYYPFLESHQHYSIAREQMTGGGCVVTFVMKGGLEDAKRFMDSLEMIFIGPSFGGPETLITHPATVSYYDYTREQRYELGIIDTLFRLAVGLEEVDDIIDDLEGAFRKADHRRS